MELVEMKELSITVIGRSGPKYGDGNEILLEDGVGDMITIGWLDPYGCEGEGHYLATGLEPGRYRLERVDE